MTTDTQPPTNRGDVVMGTSRPLVRQTSIIAFPTIAELDARMADINAKYVSTRLHIERAIALLERAIAKAEGRYI